MVPRLVFEVIHRNPEEIGDNSAIIGFVAYVFNSIDIAPGLDPSEFELIVPDGTTIVNFAGGDQQAGGARPEVKKANGPTVVVKADQP